MIDNVKEYIDKIDMHLSKGEYEEISSIFTDDFMRRIDCDELAYLSLYVMIYRDEKQNGIPKTSLSLRSTADELISLFLRLKFYLWEFEFDDNDATAHELVNFIVANEISAEFLRMAVMTSSVNKELTLKKLSLLFS